MTPGRLTVYRDGQAVAVFDLTPDRAMHLAAEILRGAAEGQREAAGEAAGAFPTPPV